MNEKEMLQDYIAARQTYEELSEQAKNAKSILEEKESLLVNALIDKGAKSTANWEGLGRFTLTEPRLYASYSEEDRDKVFSLVEQEGQKELIKPSIHSSTFSAFVKSLIERGKQIPNFIKYYDVQSGRFTSYKSKTV